MQNEVVAHAMRDFFKSWRFLRANARINDRYAEIAHAYGSQLLDIWHDEGIDDNRRYDRQLEINQGLNRSRFTIGLSLESAGLSSFEVLTKRTTLISDTLLLSHNWAGNSHDLGAKDIYQHRRVGESLLINTGPEGPPIMKPKYEYRDSTVYRMLCPSLAGLGKWIIDTKLLLKAGLVWYLPSYMVEARRKEEEWDKGQEPVVKRLHAVDYLIRNGRAVDASGAEPIKSQLVHPVLQIDLPFLEGVDLQDFSKITLEEFGAYSGFRDFLRQRFLDMDDAMNAVESDRELIKLGLQIKDEVRAARTELARVQRRRAVTITGAVIGSVGAVLVAVYGPALAAAVAAMGASGGLWGIIHAATENSTRHLQEDKWYYVWVLAKKANTRGL